MPNLTGEYQKFDSADMPVIQDAWLKKFGTKPPLAVIPFLDRDQTILALVSYANDYSHAEGKHILGLMGITLEGIKSTEVKLKDGIPIAPATKTARLTWLEGNSQVVVQIDLKSNVYKEWERTVWQQI